MIAKLSLAFVVSSSLAAAQQLDYGSLHPVRGLPKHAGVYDVSTGKFRPVGAKSATASVQTIYNNTCSVTAMFSARVACEDLYDEGRLPEFVGTVGQTWYPDHRVEQFEVAYCTSAVTGTVDLDWEFYDTQSGLGAGGSCSFGTAGVPPVFTAGVFGFSSSALGFPLPGSTSQSTTACWILGFTTGTNVVCIDSSNSANDQFVFRVAQNNTQAQLGAGAAGPLVAGNPNASAPGGGTFHHPPGIDPVSGNPCGHGLDTQDLFWINTDGVAIGGVPPGNCPGGGTGPVSTGCYWFGGFPSNPFASFYLKIEGNGSCGEAGNYTAYCTAKVNSLGCTPTLGWSGLVSATGCVFFPTDFHADNLVGNKSGLWFYGTNGLTAVPFQGGHLCVKNPIKRLAVQNSGGQSTACNGSISMDFNAHICSGVDPSLVAGQLVGAQCWSRDPGSPSGTNLTAGVAFTIFP